MPAVCTTPWATMLHGLAWPGRCPPHMHGVHARQPLHACTRQHQTKTPTYLRLCSPFILRSAHAFAVLTSQEAMMDSLLYRLSVGRPSQWRPGNPAAHNAALGTAEATTNQRPNIPLTSYLAAPWQLSRPLHGQHAPGCLLPTSPSCGAAAVRSPDPSGHGTAFAAAPACPLPAAHRRALRERISCTPCTSASR